MSTDIYKIKYIKYKKKYNELKKLMSSVNDIIDKIIIVPKEYDILNSTQKSLFELYETTKLNEPISYIKKKYFNELKTKNKLTIKCNKNILDKNIISPDEYFLLDDSDKAKYEINESDFEKFPNRVVPKNYKKSIK